MEAADGYEMVFNMPFAKACSLLTAKARKRGRTDEEVAAATS